MTIRSFASASLLLLLLAGTACQPGSAAEDTGEESKSSSKKKKKTTADGDADDMGNDETDGGVADNLDGGSTGDATAKMDASAPAQPLLVERTSFPIPGCGYRAVGYGLDAPGGQVGKRLSIPFCITNTQANRYIADGNTSGTCVGDSGGPLYLEGTNIVVATLSGIAFKTSGTTDPNGCGANYYSLYSPIEAQLPWIMTALASVPELK